MLLLILLRVWNSGIGRASLSGEYPEGRFAGQALPIDQGAAAFVPLLACVALAIDFHDHHEVIKSMLAPAANPRHPPIAEAGAQRYGRAKVQELRFQLHRVDRFESTHSLLR
jgi:hypothetical protein